MDDPFAFIVPDFRSYLSSQQDQLKRSLFARQDEIFTPEASRRQPVASAAADAHPIVPAAEAPKLNAGASPSEENFRTQNLGFSRERNWSPVIEEVHSDEEDRLREVAGEPSRVGAKRTVEKQSPIEDPSSSKRIRVSRGVGISIERQLKRKRNLEKLKGDVETVVIGDTNDHLLEEIGAEDAAEDLSREKRREHEENEESESRPEREEPVDEEWRLALEVLALLAKEERKERGGDRGEVDFIATVKRRGINFPRPNWMQ